MGQGAVFCLQKSGQLAKAKGSVLHVQAATEHMPFQVDTP